MAVLSHSDTIRKLPDQTIRLISAGEVITRPFNVVKELVENSIDAGAHNIRVSIDQGGLKLIEVADNGHGISRANARLLCHRYTTSKLEAASDLQRITTFGFRGEALSSISEVADIEVNSFNIKCDSIGWHGEYKRGDLCKPIVDRTVTLPGTHIKVRDLFLNTLPRRKSLSSGVLEEKKAIIDLITKLAIHHRDRITFQLNEVGFNELVCSLAPLAFAPCIGSFFGTVMESNLMELTIITDPKDIGSNDHFKSDIHIGFSYKKAASTLHQSRMILFVNDRLVESNELKREVSALILEFFGGKQYSSLIYISLRVPPTDIDVNTHPAKATITLHYQREIIALVLTKLRAKFDENLSSQVVPNQAMLRQRTIGELLNNSSDQTPSTEEAGINQERLRRLAPGSLSQSSPSVRRPYEQVHNDCTQPNLSQMLARPSRIRREMNLKSLAILRARIADERTPDEMSIKTIKNSTFVGIFDHHRALIQHGTKLFAINLKSFLKEQFYQFYLFDFGNFPAIEILPPGNKIDFMIETHLDHVKKYEPEMYDKLALKTPESIVEKLLKHADMFEDYLKMKITRQEILTIPNVIPEHVPNLAYLGQFLVSMANDVDYTNELNCFHQMGRTLADFYSNPPVLVGDLQVQRKYHEFVDMRLYDAIRRYLILPDWLITKQNICQITDTKDLYKVFERC